MVEVAAEALTDEEIQQQELEIVLAQCDKIIAESTEDDDLSDMFNMVKRVLLGKKSKFEEWNKSITESRRIKL